MLLLTALELEPLLTFFYRGNIHVSCVMWYSVIQAATSLLVGGDRFSMPFKLDGPPLHRLINSNLRKLEAVRGARYSRACGCILVTKRISFAGKHSTLLLERVVQREVHATARNRLLEPVLALMRVEPT